MISLSRKTDYALLALSYLAQEGGKRAANTKEIAEHYDIPVELLAKILQQLAKAHLLGSTPGPTGGYRLALPATEISVGTVASIIDGPPALMHCMKVTDNGCEQLTRCSIRRPLEQINARIFEMLNRISVAEILQEERSHTSFPIVWRDHEQHGHPNH